MAYPFRGNTSTVAYSWAYGLPMVLENFRVVNKTAGAVTMNVYLINGANEINISPLNKSISANDMYNETDTNIVVLATDRVKVQVGGSCDYNFTFNNLKQVE